MAIEKRSHPHTGRTPKVRGEGGSDSKVITIPKGIADKLDLSTGERPSDIVFDPDGREVSFQFEVANGN